MIVTKPSRDRDFRCLADRCGDTCCAGWQIVVDDVSADRFRCMEDAMGKRLQQALITVDGETQLRRHPNGRCTLLNENNLCDLYALYGQGALCRNCRLHPRFVAEYGARREVMLGLSCPAWIETYLLDEEKVTFTTEETDEPITDYTDIDAALFFKLYRARSAALEMVQNSSLTIDARLLRLLALAAELDGGGEEDCPQQNILPAYIKKLQGLEILTPAWRNALSAPVVSCREEDLSGLWEKVLVYDVFRFFLRGVYDGRVLPWVNCAVFHVLVLRRLSRGCTREEAAELTRLYSKEIEHNEENLTALHRAFCRRSGRFSAAGLHKAIEEESK